MHTFFVKDILRWNYFFGEKSYFYSVKEKVFDLKILLGLIFFLNFYFLPYLLNFLPYFNYQHFRFLFLIYLFAVFFLYRNYPKLNNAIIPLIFYLFISLFSQFVLLLLLDLESVWNREDFFFLFSEKIDFKFVKHREIAKLRILQFISLWIILIFLLFFAFLMRKQIYQKFQEIKDYFLSFVIFFIFLIVFGLFLFNNSNYNVFKFDFLTANQEKILFTYNLSSKLGKFFYIITLVVLTPLWEELIFRYSVFAIFGRQRVGWSILFSTFWFSFSHFYLSEFKSDDLVAFFKNIFASNLSFYLYIALLLSAVYCLYDLNLIYPIILHWFINFNFALVWIVNLF